MRSFLSLAVLLLFLAAPRFAPAQEPPPPPPDTTPESFVPSGDDQDNNGDNGGVSFQDFYDQLGGEGTWIQTDDYGYAWQPDVNDPDWRPYEDGQWAYSDDGWTWVSDEPWGWATYHYGRWANLVGCGWVWVPGYVWAPAWVSWRYGGGYCGWAPLPPGTIVGAEFGGPGVRTGIGFHFGGDVDVAFGIGAGWYNFVPVGEIGNRHLRGVILSRDRNFTVIHQTTNITNINLNRNRMTAGNRFGGVAAGGPPINEINAQAHQPVRTVRLTAQAQPGRGTLHGDTLSVYAPRVNPATYHQARPGAVAQTLAHPAIDRGTAIGNRFSVTRNVQAPAPSAEAIQSAAQAERQTSDRSRVATEETPPRVSTPSFSELQPMSSSSHRSETERSYPNGPPATGKTAPAPRREAERPSPGASGNEGRTYATPEAPQHTFAPSDNTPSYHPLAEHPSSGAGGSPYHTNPSPGSHPAPSGNPPGNGGSSHPSGGNAPSHGGGGGSGGSHGGGGGGSGGNGGGGSSGGGHH